MNGDIRPLKEAIDIKADLNIGLFIFIALLIILIVGFFLYLRNRKKPKYIPEEVLKSPQEIAAEELNALLAKKLIEKGMYKEYYIEISDIVRKFIEGEFKIQALDKTTWELYQEMRIKKLNRKSIDSIKDFLEECDQVKFAKYIPKKKETEELTDRAKSIVTV